MLKSAKIGKFISVAAVLALTVLAAVGGWWYFRPGGAFVTPSREEYPLRGVDISSHNGPIDFKALAADSIDFAIIKATEGTSFKDAAFRRNYEGAREAGLKVGAYHFFRFDAPGYMQALNFLHSVRGRSLDLPLVVDIEEWTNPTDRPISTIVAQLRILIEQLEQAGYCVMLYSNKDGYERYLRGHFDRYPLWIASLTSEPSDGWLLWQFTHRGNTDGISGNVDINTFNGERGDWENWLVESAQSAQ